ncbi:TlpA disulfide reductase family protein [Pseudoxanthomonas sp. CF125]|jgi:thiol-disulfide isomerase/thioredoxin|uniref:TlpA family protein disulfide reductase n=1 Tax=Pseudoxanthomonas sp. CF125 TaxID=1855303 RepID=UPI0008914053|nr:TlpA disulfide reductase family protein [Pseudoxanthomonas sp. CF125]SDQ83040.1 Thiol-disulfide isomerase or thioredoxin [Pseudoxanthomonas sp. CF125]
MKLTTTRILLVAGAAGVLGVLASLWWGGSPLLRTDTGQRALQAAMEASAPEPPRGVKPARPGEPMPTIALPDLQGRTQSLPRAYAGRPLLINVWASWCGPCIEEMPELDRYARAEGPAGVQVIGLALDTPENIRQFLTRVPVTYPILVDTPGPADASVWLGNRKGVLPYSVLVGADGRILKQKVGPFAAGEIDSWTK